MRARRIHVADLRQIRLGDDQHKKVRQQIASGGQPQRLLSIENDHRVVAVCILQINILKSGPAHPSVNAEGDQGRRARVGVHHAEGQASGEAHIGRQAGNDPISAVRPVAGVVDPLARDKWIYAVIDPVGIEKVWAQRIPGRGSPHQITRPIRVGMRAGIILVHGLNAHFAEITIGIATGTAEIGIIDVHSVRKIPVFGLPQICRWQHAQPHRLELSARVGGQIRDVRHADGGGVSRVRLQPGVSYVLARGGATDQQAPGDIGPIQGQVNAAAIDGEAARRTGIKTDAAARIRKDHRVLREKIANQRRHVAADLVQSCVINER